jgi:hypothetical protein
LTDIEAAATIDRSSFAGLDRLQGKEVSMGFSNAISIYVRWPLPTA